MVLKDKRQPDTLSKSDNRESRRHERRRCSESTCFSANRQLYEGELKNMSAGGTYIQVRGRFEIDQHVIVAGIVAEDGREEKRTGKIVRVDPSGIAVQFTDKHYSVAP